MYEPPSCVWSGDCQRREAEEDELPSSETLSLYWVHVKLACRYFPGRLDVLLHFTLPRWFFDYASIEIIASVQP